MRGLGRSAGSGWMDQWQVDPRENLPPYFFSIILVVAGIVGGAMAVGGVEPSQRTEMTSTLLGFFRGMSSWTGSDGIQMMKASVWSNLKTLGLLWVLGLSAVGIPLIPVILFGRGFLLGFAVGFMIGEMGWKGLVFALFSVFPPNLLVLPCVIVVGAASMSFSGYVLKSWWGRSYPVLREAIRYTKLCMLGAVALLAAGIVEGYVCPVLVKVASFVVRL